MKRNRIKRIAIRLLFVAVFIFVVHLVATIGTIVILMFTNISSEHKQQEQPQEEIIFDRIETTKTNIC